MARLDRHQYLIHMGYDGSRFFGVAPQPGLPTVADALRQRLEDAAGQRARALSFTARTDRGVWAEHNMATCWFLPPMDREAFEAQVAEERDDGLVAVRAEATGFHTHARNVSAGKWYRYRVRMDGRADSRAWLLSRPLDVGMIRNLAGRFLGTHDFNAYRYKCSAPNSVKTLTHFDVSEHDGVVVFDIQGDGFLRHMVRKLVAVCVLTGLGEYEAERAIHLLETGASRGTPKAAPPEGLTLMKIHRVPV